MFQNYCPFQELRGVFYTTAIISTIIVIDLKTEICILRKTSLLLNACQWYMTWQRILIHANIKYHLGLDWKLKKAIWKRKIILRKKRTSLTANIDSLSSAKPQDLQTILGNSTGYQNLCIYIRKFHPANDTCVVKVPHFYGETEAKSVKQVINPFRLCQGNNFTVISLSQ